MGLFTTSSASAMLRCLLVVAMCVAVQGWGRYAPAVNPLSLYAGLGKRNPYDFGIGKRLAYEAGVKGEPYGFGTEKHFEYESGKEDVADVHSWVKRQPYNFG